MGNMKFNTAKALAAVALTGSFVVAALPGVSSASSSSLTAAGLNTGYTTMLSSSVMGAAKTLSTTKLSIGVILPDETSSTRYVEFDAPDMTTAFTDAGLSPTQYKVDNAQGSDTTAISDAQADLAAGAKVLVVDVEDQATAQTIQSDAAADGAKVIDYDRLYTDGSVYVSFNNVTVGTLIGQGELACLTADQVKKPDIYVMDGSATDPNAAMFASGYDAVLEKAGYAPQEGGTGNSKTVDESAGTWTPSQALTDFQGAYSAHPSINAVVTPNDENAAPIISYLQSKGLKPNKFPFTGQDATLTGFQNIISGYQCGTVYKPVWAEAQAAAVSAIFLAAGDAVPSTLATGTTPLTGTGAGVGTAVSTVELTPEWVTAKTVESTVIKDGVINPNALCTSAKPTVSGYKAPTFAADCKTFGIK